MKLFPSLIIILALFSCTPKPTTEIYQSSNLKPGWVKSVEYDPIYIQGVGSAEYRGDPNLTAEAAKSAALREISQQIKVTVKSSIKDSVWVSDGIYKNSFESVVESIVGAINLDNVEIYATWVEKPSNRHWCLARLNRAEYDRTRREYRESAVKIIVDYLASGEFNVIRTDYQKALVDLLTASYYANFLLGDYEEVEFPPLSGVYINVSRRINEDLDDLFNKVVVKVKEKPVALKAWEQGFSTIIVHAYFDAERQVMLKRIPLAIADMTDETFHQIVETDNSGSAEFHVANNHFKTDKSFLIRIELDSINIERMLLDNNLPISLSSRHSVPFANFQVTVLPVKLFIKSSETIDSSIVPGEEEYVTSSVKNAFTQISGFEIVHYRSSSDYMIDLTTSCNYRGRAKDFYWYDTNIKAEIIDDTGHIVFSDVYPPVKGFGLTRTDGGKIALQKAGVVMGENYVQELINYFIERE